MRNRAWPHTGGHECVCGPDNETLSLKVLIKLWVPRPSRSEHFADARQISAGFFLCGFIVHFPSVKGRGGEGEGVEGNAPARRARAAVQCNHDATTACGLQTRRMVRRQQPRMGAGRRAANPRLPSGPHGTRQLLPPESNVGGILRPRPLGAAGKVAESTRACLSTSILSASVSVGVVRGLPSTACAVVGPAGRPRHDPVGRPRGAAKSEALGRCSRGSRVAAERQLLLPLPPPPG